MELPLVGLNLVGVYLALSRKLMIAFHNIIIQDIVLCLFF